MGLPWGAVPTAAYTDDPESSLGKAISFWKKGYLWMDGLMVSAGLDDLETDRQPWLPRESLAAQRKGARETRNTAFLDPGLSATRGCS